MNVIVMACGGASLKSDFRVIQRQPPAKMGFEEYPAYRRAARQCFHQRRGMGSVEFFSRKQRLQPSHIPAEQAGLPGARLRVSLAGLGKSPVAYRGGRFATVRVDKGKVDFSSVTMGEVGYHWKPFEKGEGCIKVRNSESPEFR